MALAGSTGCGAGCRVWDDFAADADEIPRHVHACGSAGAGKCEYDGGESDGAGQRWSWDGVPKPRAFWWGRIEDGGVVDGVVISDRDLFGVFEVFQEGAVAEAVVRYWRDMGEDRGIKAQRC